MKTLGFNLSEAAVHRPVPGNFIKKRNSGTGP